MIEITTDSCGTGLFQNSNRSSGQGRGYTESTLSGGFTPKRKGYSRETVKKKKPTRTYICETGDGYTKIIANESITGRRRRAARVYINKKLFVMPHTNETTEFKDAVSWIKPRGAFSARPSLRRCWMPVFFYRQRQPDPRRDGGTPLLPPPPLFKVKREVALQYAAGCNYCT